MTDNDTYLALCAARRKRRIADAQRYQTRKANERARHEAKSEAAWAVINGTMTHEEFLAKFYGDKT